MAETEFKFLLAMPNELDQQIVEACGNLHCSKSSFLREAARLRLKAMATGEANLGPSGVKGSERPEGPFDGVFPWVVAGMLFLALIVHGIRTFG